MIALLFNISADVVTITLLCSGKIWRYKYICYRNNQVDKIMEQPNYQKGQCRKPGYGTNMANQCRVNQAMGPTLEDEALGKRHFQYGTQKIIHTL